MIKGIGMAIEFFGVAQAEAICVLGGRLRAALQIALVAKYDRNRGCLRASATALFLSSVRL
jgi:hypothetical protein